MSREAVACTVLDALCYWRSRRRRLPGASRQAQRLSSAEIPEAKVVKSAPVDDETAAAVKAAAAAAGDAPAS